MHDKDGVSVSMPQLQVSPVTFLFSNSSVVCLGMSWAETERRDMIKILLKSSKNFKPAGVGSRLSDGEPGGPWLTVWELVSTNPCVDFVFRARWMTTISHGGGEKQQRSTKSFAFADKEPLANIFEHSSQRWLKKAFLGHCRFVLATNNVRRGWRTIGCWQWEAWSNCNRWGKIM